MLNVTELYFIMVQMANLVMCRLPKNVRIVPDIDSKFSNILKALAPWLQEMASSVLKALTTEPQVLVQRGDEPISVTFLLVFLFISG